MLTKQRLLTPGPTQLPERVRFAMAQDMIHHRKPAFKAILGRVQTGLQELFGTSEVILPLASSGTGAMVAAVCSLFRKGEKVLVVEGGKFAQRWIRICEAHEVIPVILKVEWGNGVAPEAVAAALDANPDITGVLVQLSETSTGVQHPIRALANITKNRSTLLVVDGISGVSITPCPMDAWGIDCLVTGSQKGLMLPPGLALIALSARAWKKNETVGVRNYYFDLAKEREGCLKQQTNFTTPVSLIMGLDESLAMFGEVGFDAIYRKQWAMTTMVRAGITALGLTLFAKEHYAWGVTSILLPEGIPASKLLAHALERYGVVMTAGQDHLKERMVRLGHMGWVDYADIAAGLHAFAGSFVACGGFLNTRGYLEQALSAYWTALDEGYPS